MVIDETTLRILKESFKAWVETKEDIKTLNKSNSELLKSLADSLKVKKSELSKTFSYLRILEEKGEDELDNVVTLFESIKGS